MKSFKHALIGLMALVVAPAAFAQDNVVRIEAGADIQEALQEALILAEPGTVIELPEGRFELSAGLSLDVSDITLRGAGMDKTVLSFKNQIAGSEGLLITSDRTSIENLAVEDTPGDGIKAKGVDTVSFRSVRVEWTRGPNAENGAYGLYPVESKNVLIEGSLVKGASDAGIYVGQSQDIIVRNNRAELNVAGIEIENSYRADVYGNTATHNTGGILVFDLPNLPQMGGHSVRVYQNKVVNNDTPNFAPPGNIVATVPRGSGIMIMANREVEVFENEIGENASANILLVAYPREYNDPTYNPLPRRVYVHDNKHGRAGWDPDGAVKGMIAPRTGTPVPHIVWDGVVDGFWAGLFGPDEEETIMIQEPEGTTFANLQFVKDYILPWGADPDRDIEAYAGSYEFRGPVKLPQDTAMAANN
ncbi:parallel beta-helix domain-containing protein [Kordiimonas lipolytica]|uniref:Parallel beta-helix domain-containing protein n=1 Tax=Kordiimonas lipolytica TaxID=1662421 RepID=A0ABV8U7A4_9PROT|nr:parallel beta-helix domain-containing protein [Kordiimonas lipolytica]